MCHSHAVVRQTDEGCFFDTSLAELHSLYGTWLTCRYRFCWKVFDSVNFGVRNRGSTFARLWTDGTRHREYQYWRHFLPKILYVSQAHINYVYLSGSFIIFISNCGERSRGCLSNSFSVSPPSTQRQTSLVSRTFPAYDIKISISFFFLSSPIYIGFLVPGCQLSYIFSFAEIEVCHNV